MKFILVSLICIFQIQAFAKKKTLIVSFPEFAPYSYVLNGVEKGICVDLIKSKLGKSYNLLFKATPWTRTLSELKDGRIDMIGCLSFDKDRVQYAEFSDPIFQLENVMIKKRGTKFNANTLEDLRSYVGVVVRGDSNSKYFKPKNFHSVSSVNSLIDFIILERAQVGVLPKEIFNNEIKNFQNIRRSQIVTKVISVEDIYLAVSRKGKAIKEIKKINNLLAL